MSRSTPLSMRGDPPRQALELDGQSAANWFNLALTYIQLHQFKEARDALESAIKLGGENPLYYEALELLLPKVNPF